MNVDKIGSFNDYSRETEEEKRGSEKVRDESIYPNDF
jgi:hypothetical protein